MTLSGLATALSRFAAVALYAAFAYAHLLAFRARPRASLLLIVLLEALFAVFLLVRREAGRTSWKPWDWLTTACGTLAPMLLRPAPGATDSPGGQALQLAGTLLAIAGVASLNRSIGLVPAQRGLRQSGLYRWVRHPLYASYWIAWVGYLWSNPSWANAGVVAASAALAVVRIRNEERFLASDPAYGDYCRRTRWRLIPFVY